MKKVFALLLAVIGFAIAVNANGAYTATTVFQVNHFIAQNHGADSLTGIDSVKVFDISIDGTAQDYVIAVSDSQGTADSTKLLYYVYGLKNVLLTNGSLDTLRSTTNAYKVVDLPLNKTVLGTRIVVKWMGGVAALKRRLTSAVLYKVIPVTGYQANIAR
jgi:hypothetical protein